MSQENSQETPGNLQKTPAYAGSCSFFFWIKPYAFGLMELNKVKIIRKHLGAAQPQLVKCYTVRLTPIVLYCVSMWCYTEVSASLLK